MSLLGRLSFVALLIFTGPALASPPNDDYATALLIGNNVSYVEGALAGSTVESGEPDISNTIRVANGVWHKFVAPSSGLVTILSAEPGSDNTSNHQIDVFHGVSFRLRNRIAVALPEQIRRNNVSQTIIRSTFQVYKGRTYHIRISGKVSGSSAYELSYAFHIFHDGAKGKIRHVSLRSMYWPLHEFAYIARSDFWRLSAYHYRDFVTLNSTAFARSMFGSSNGPDSRVLLHTNVLRARSGNKPGVVLSEHRQGNAYGNRWGLWRHNWRLDVRTGSHVSRFNVPYVIHRYRTDRSDIRVDVPTNATASALLGSSARVTISVTNTGSFPLTNCRILTVNRGNSKLNGLRMSWRVPGRPINATFGLQVGQSASVELLLVPTRTGLREGYNVYANCTESPIRNGENEISIEGLQN